MAEETVVVVAGEAEEGHSLNPQTQEEKVKAKAAEKGWKPLDQYDGDETDWVDAKEFLGRQKLYDRIDDLKKTISKQTKAFQQDMQVVVSNMSKIKEQEYKKALSSLEKQRKDAVEQQDIEAVVAVSKEIEELKEERVEQKAALKEGAQTTGEGTPEFLEWQAQNKWFNDNQEMRQDAINYGIGYAAGNPNKTQMEVLEFVTKKMKRMYPEEFEKKGPKKVTSQVESGTANRVAPGSPSGKKITMDDLPAEHRAIARTIIKSGALKKQAEKNKRSEAEEYLAQYQQSN